MGVGAQVTTHIMMNKMYKRVLHIGNGQMRRYGNTRVSWTKKLYRGLIQNGHEVYFFSDRDVAAFEAPFGWRDLGRGQANKKLIQAGTDYEPDLIIVGHADIILNETLVMLKRKTGATVIHCNNDPLFIPSNVDKIKKRLKVCDSCFISSGREILEDTFPEDRHRVFHMPNPVDPAVECYNASLLKRHELDRDLIFCGNATDHTERGKLLQSLKDSLSLEVRFHTFGMFGMAPIWGRGYDHALSLTAMGLNINRQEGHHWYSSARMAQLGGNGLLTFTHQENGFHTLFPENSLVYYSNVQELKEKVEYYVINDGERRAQASLTHAFFHKNMTGKLNSQYILERSLGLDSPKYIWE